jgi:hypothetical protein
MQVKIQKSYREIVAICDSELLGKRFEEDKFQLDIKESFYKGEEKTKPEVLEIIKRMSVEDATFNIVGKEATETALEAGIIAKEGIKEIQGIPFALVLL